jgi:hypothetical protein
MGIRHFSPAATAALLLAAVLGAAPGCDGHDGGTGGQAGAAPCTSSGGPVEDGSTDQHCIDTEGNAIVQAVGKCSTDVTTGTAGGGGAGGSGAGQEEPAAVLTSHQGADDDCKYDVSFTNTCVELNRPVTFTLTMSQRANHEPATGAVPNSPEVFLADNPSHISLSRGIRAPESPKGTYTIGPIVFDRSGRWVVRFHFYESCSDVPEDSPHGHIAFYIDVP